MNVTGEFDTRPEVSQGQVVPWEEGCKGDLGWLEACLIVALELSYEDKQRQTHQGRSRTHLP